MMSDKKNYVTPDGTLVFPHLEEPDTRFDPDGKYHTYLKLDPNDKESAEFLKEVKKLCPKDGRVPFKDDKTKSGEKTGAILVKFASAYKPRLFDDQLHQWMEESRIGGGTKAAISYRPNVYKQFGGGVNLYLQAVKVLEFVPLQANGESFGFGASADTERESPLDGETEDPFA